MIQPDPGELELAAQAYQANLSPRTLLLDRLERYSTREQYEGRPPFMSDERPLLERAPCIATDMVDRAILSHTSMIAGEGRFPRLSTRLDEDGTLLDEDFGLSKADSALLDPFLRSTVKRLRLQAAFGHLVDAALRSGTSCALVCVRRGQPEIDMPAAKWCTPEFDPSAPDIVRRIEIRYPYVREERDPTSGRVRVIAYLYRRSIDERRDVVYKPARANRDGTDPAFWAVQTSVDHGLGFCPAVWYRHAARESVISRLDGRALHGRLMSEIYAHDLSRSQVHRGVVSTLDPMIAEIGVEPGFGLSPVQQPSPPDTSDDPFSAYRTGYNRPPWRGTGAGHRRAPGMRIQYPVGATVEQLTLPGDAFEAGFKNVEDLRHHIASALHWCPNDEEQTKNVRGTSAPMSGKAREWLYRKQTEFDDGLRLGAGTHCLLPLVSVLLRTLLGVSRTGRDVRLPGMRKIVPVLARFEAEEERDDGAVTRAWHSPDVDLVWPPYFQPTDDDEKLVADTVRADLAAGLITLETAVQKRAPWYGIGDVAAYVEELERKKAQETAALHEANALLAGAESNKTDEPEDPAEMPPANRNSNAPPPKG